MQGSFLPAFLLGPDPRATAEVMDENYEMQPFFCRSESTQGLVLGSAFPAA